jgi:hypothetical protein
MTFLGVGSNGLLVTKSSYFTVLSKMPLRGFFPTLAWWIVSNVRITSLTPTFLHGSLRLENVGVAQLQRRRFEIQSSGALSRYIFSSPSVSAPLCDRASDADAGSPDERVLADRAASPSPKMGSSWLSSLPWWIQPSIGPVYENL